MILSVVFDSVGFGEWLVLLAVVLVVVGPKNLPSTARKIGSYYAKFCRAAETFKRQILEMDRDLERAAEEAERSVRETGAQIERALDVGENGGKTGGGETGGAESVAADGETAAKKEGDGHPAPEEP